MRRQTFEQIDSVGRNKQVRRVVIEDDAPVGWTPVWKVAGGIMIAETIGSGLLLIGLLLYGLAQRHGWL